MVFWNTDTLPPSSDIDDEGNTYYLVKFEKYTPELAMYINGEWWTSYTSKLMVEVIGWTEI